MADRLFAWMRILTITFTSKSLRRSITFGDDETTNLSMSIDCYKYMSTLKDACTIKIDNLTYNEIVELMQGRYFTVEVKAGYREGNTATIFKGGVLYISNAINDRKTHTAIILCASELVAQFNQQRLSLSLNSGINLYSAIKFICQQAGIQNSNVSESFKNTFLQEIVNVNDTAGSWIDKLCKQNSSYISNSDSVNGSTLSIFDALQTNGRIQILDSSTIDLTGGYPRLTSDGLSLTVLPTMSFACGDTIKIDNSLINLEVGDASQINTNPGIYLDKDGCYVIIEQHYSLENRGSSFSLDMTCRARSLLSNIASR